MTRLIAAIAFLCLFSSISDARPRQARTDSGTLAQCLDGSYRQTCGGADRRILSHPRAVAGHGDPRPSRWCGWWMRQELNVADRSGNLARWWKGYGANAHGPAVGAIVVWSHHVGLITGKTDTGWIVKSGNDGHAVRERERPLQGAIAYRWPNQVASR